MVSGFALEWIEMASVTAGRRYADVSGFALEWIEIRGFGQAIP